MSTQPKRVMTSGPDNQDYEDHPRYSAKYGYPEKDEQLVRAVLRGLAYRMPDDAWEQAMVRFATKREAVREVGRIVRAALEAGMPNAERNALYVRLMKEAGQDVCFTCGGPVHGAACEDPDSGMWERETDNAHERAEGEAA